ncbi:MAG: hypothetical protein IJJ33_13600 [Victivallales bacterium]|nr:hypothetical protein [Victivallales bacterium]
MRILTTGAAEDIARAAGGDCWFELLDVNLGENYGDMLDNWRHEAPDAYAQLKCRLLCHTVTKTTPGYTGGIADGHLLLVNADIPVLEEAPSITWEQAEDNPDIEDVDYWENAETDEITGKLHWPTPYARDASAQAQGADGAQTMQIRLGDPSGALWQFVLAAGGLRGCAATLSLARLKEYPWNTGPDGSPLEVQPGKTVTAALAFPAEVSVEYTIRSCATDGTSFTFNLSTDNPFSRQCPPRRMYKARCRWVFKSPECGYAGNADSCDRTIADCRAKNNIARIGCFPGCGTGGLAQ